MLKKKGGGNTMTLKDFHGGSIPTDLPLPSAPGVVVRPLDRPSYDRHAWGNPMMGRSDHRVRPSSSPATRDFDDKSPCLTHTAHIGRNFDEDERKPLDGGSIPCRTVSDDSIWFSPRTVELKPESAPTERLSGRQGLAPMSGMQSGVVNSSSGRLAEGTNSLNLQCNGGKAVGGSHPNAWTARKEVMMVPETVQSTWSGPSAVSKLAHASALEKVSSGRWQLNHTTQYQNDVEVIRYSERENGSHSKGYDNLDYQKLDVVDGKDYYDASLARHMERGLNIEDGIQSGRKELPDRERVRVPTYSEVKGRNITTKDEVQPVYVEGKFSGRGLHPQLPAEASDQPNLNAYKVAKPLDNLETPAIGRKQGFQHPSDSGRAECNEVHGNSNSAKPGLVGTESGNRAVERPKLQLKPRSQPVEHLEGNFHRERNALFGGASPRELVLKERGIDDVAINSYDSDQNSDRVKHSTPKTETVHVHTIPSRNDEKTENLPLDRRIVKNSEKKDHRVDVERADMQRKNWRKETWKNGKDNERKQQPQQQQMRQPSPETWRKPAVQPKPSSPDASGPRYGKAASAVELAQAFSRSVSDPKAADRFSDQRGLPGRSHVPFSRLTGPIPRPQINGY